MQISSSFKHQSSINRGLSRGSRALPGIRPPALSLLGVPGLAAGSLHPDVATPGSLLAVQGVHRSLRFVDGAEVDEQVVVVTRLEALGGMGAEQFADGFADI